jgi:integrase
MPRKRQPPRLYLREDERVWVIRDGQTTLRTGCAEADIEGAQEALQKYLAGKFKPVARERDPDNLTVAEVLAAYGSEHAPHVVDSERIGFALAHLEVFWNGKRLSDVRGSTCREYAQWREMSPGTVRRELGVLSAAIGHWHKEHGPLVAVPVVTLPDAPEPHAEFLTHQEAALLLAGALGWYRERWSDVATRQEHHRWRRNPFRIQRHAARFILLGLYTGTRPGAIADVRWFRNKDGGWIDIEAGVMHRRGIGRTETNKRKPPTRLGKRILAHLRRWKRLDDKAREKAAEEAGHPVTTLVHVVSYDGEPITKIRRAWASAVELAGLGEHVTPHILRHTRATWELQDGIDPYEVAGHVGMSVQTLLRVYGHHHPDFQRKAAEV